ncbi:hypothetical protein FRC01_014764 [Tulasnella sp. 417]|nr:hypothetical protein FRC01_014764 [Tulasnella sp. 417]
MERFKATDPVKPFSDKVARRSKSERAKNLPEGLNGVRRELESISLSSSTNDTVPASHLVTTYDSQWPPIPSTWTKCSTTGAWNTSKYPGHQLPISPTSNSSRLTDRYPAAYKDFFGMPSGAPCIYKSGPAWPERKGLLEAQRFIREARPVYAHPIAGSWLKIGTDIYKFLDSSSVMWTSIDPVAFANAGEEKPFCPLLMWIGVKHESLLFDAAVAAADAIKGILSIAGFPEIEVAFRESEVTHSVAGPKLVSFNPLLDPIPEFRKPFTPTLGLSIAPLKTPHYEGTGALYFRLGKDDERVVLLTAAHVARPPPAYPNAGTSRKHTRQHAKTSSPSATRATRMLRMT